MKTVTFKVSKSGIYHYKEFRLNENGLIDPQVISFFYTKKEDHPMIKQESTVDEVLALLKNFAYGKKASVYKIDNRPVLVNDEMVCSVDDSVENIQGLIKKEINKLLEEHLEKILGKFKIDFMDILIYKNRKYVSLSNDPDKHYAVNFLCYKLLYGLGKVKYNSFSNETGYIENYLDYFIHDIKENIQKQTRKA